MSLKDEARILAGKFFMINLNIGKWSSLHYKKNFDIEGVSFNLTSRQFSILIMISKLNLSTVSEMEEFISLSKSSLSLTISKLVEEGYLKKEYPKGIADKRRVYFCVTEKGNIILNEAIERLIDSFHRLYISLDEPRRFEFKEGIEKLSNAMIEEGEMT